MKKSSHRNPPPSSPPTKPLLIVLSGPSGAGKDAILSRMKKSGYPLEYITTVTTRPRRAKEKNHIDYHFVSAEKFQKMLAHNELLEWANVYGNRYGVPYEPVKKALDKGQDVILKVDIQGAKNIKKIAPQAVFIFLVPSAMEELPTRLKQRQTESPSNLALRLKTAEEEMKQLSLFDYVVVNKQGKINHTVSEIEAILAAEKCRVNPREVAL